MGATWKLYVFFLVVLPLFGVAFGAANTKSYGLKAEKSCVVSVTLLYRGYVGGLLWESGRENGNYYYSMPR